MRTVILTAVKEELECVLAAAPFQFDKEIRAYRCLNDKGIIAATTGPGLKLKREIRAILEVHEPDIIINAGLVGILSEQDTIQPGERLQLGSVIRAADGTEFPGGPGGHDRLVTVRAPTFDPADKMDLLSRWKARACDMEGAEVIALVGQIRPLATHSGVVLCKVAGDLPVHHELFKDEYLLRSWPSRPWYDKLFTAVGFPGGLGSFRRLQKIKKQALAGLTREIQELLTKTRMLGAGDPLEALRGSRLIDSLFVPH